MLIQSPLTPPLVSIIVPARNEELNIARCVNSILKQELSLELIVVNDGSTDDTCAIVSRIAASNHRLRLISINELPSGWTGKNYAVYTGFLESSGKWILFCDADTYHYEGSLNKAVVLCETHGFDCLSYSPEQECDTFGERLLQPAVFQLLDEWFPYERVSDSERNDAAANGQYIFIRRKVMNAIGAHATVKDKILEDLEIAKILKSSGYRLHFARGTGIVKTRMYRSFREWWRGWAKSIYPLRQDRPMEILSASTKRLFMDVMPMALLLLNGFLMFQGSFNGWFALLLAIIVLFRWGRIRSMWKSSGFDPWYSVFYPLSSLVLVLMMWYSVYCYRRHGSIEWKNRIYALPPIG